MRPTGGLLASLNQLDRWLRSVDGLRRSTPSWPNCRRTGGRDWSALQSWSNRSARRTSGTRTFATSAERSGREQPSEGRLVSPEGIDHGKARPKADAVWLMSW